MSPLSPTATRELLTRLGHTPRQPLGQNFLVDGNIVRKSLAIANIGPTDTVIEIGPGLGTLTRALLDTGATVHAVELDPRLAGYLRDDLAPAFPDRLRLVEGDCVDLPLAGLPAEAASGSFKIVANLPYAISTPWLEGVLSGGRLPACMVLMLQKEAADRFAAPHDSKSFSGISILLQSAYLRRPGHKVPRACFHPVPGVDSVLFHLELRPDAYVFPQATRDLIRQLFTQRRKQIGGLLRHFAPERDFTNFWKCLEDNKLGPTARPEQIPLALWKHLV